MKVKYVAVLPVLVIAVVLAIPAVFGNDPLSLRRSSADPTPHDTSATTARASSVSPSASADPFAVQTVTHPWSPGQIQTGIQVYWPLSRTDTVADLWGKAQRDVDYAVGLGANSIALTFPFATRGRDADSVSASAQTPIPTDVAIFLREAAKAKLRVTLRPVLDEATLDPPKGWRGSIAPSSLSRWFASYQAFLDPYAAVAQQYGAATFVIGTEFNSLEGDPRWPGLIKHVAKRYQGQIAYDANWDNYLADPTIKVPAPQLGVDAYFHVAVPDGATASQIARGWSAAIDQRTTGSLSDLVFSEVGIMDQNGAFDQPGDFYATNPYNEAMQPTWYAGVCQVAKQRALGGIYFWDITFDDDPARPAPSSESDLDFAGRPSSEAAIRTCFTTTLR
jgi:hypothetical protein